MWICICFSLSDLLYSVWHSLGPPTWHHFVPFYSWVIFSYAYVPHLLYPFLYWWIVRLLPCKPWTFTHSSTLAWKIPWAEEPGRLQSIGLWRVGHDWATSLSLFTFMHWRRKWQPTPVFLPGESQGRGSLVGFSLRCRTESDMTEAT